MYTPETEREPARGEDIGEGVEIVGDAVFGEEKKLEAGEREAK